MRRHGKDDKKSLIEMIKRHGNYITFFFGGGGGDGGVT